MFKLLLVKNELDKTYDITPIAGAFTWDTYLSLTGEIDLPVMWSDSPAFPVNPCEIGDMVLLTQDGEEIGRWILCKSSQQGRNPITYTGYDFAWYLNQSKSVYQFNGVSADQAIKRILNDFGMLIGTIPPMSAKITKIYIQKTPAEIIDDILDQQEQQSGYNYSPELIKGYIDIVPTVDRVIQGTFTLAGVTADIMSVPLDAQRDRDLTQMRNRIKIITEGSNTYVTQAIAQDTANASHYGVIEETFKINAADVAKSRQVANILLSRLDKVLENNTLTLMGDTAVKAGYLINVTEPITGMSGQYLINHVKNTVNNQIHTMQVELVLPLDVTEGVVSSDSTASD
jgi:hypothetical protein